MLKKLSFIILVFSFMLFGAVAAMAIEGEGDSLSNIEGDVTTNPVLPAIEIHNEEQQEEEYSHEAVIEEYSSLFFNIDNKTENEFIKEERIKIVEDSSTKDDIQDYSIYATLSDDIHLEEGNTIVVMAFLKMGDSFELLGNPEEKFKLGGLMEPISFSLSNVGEDDSYYIRVIAFPKNSYKDLSIDNIQIYDLEIVNFDFDINNTLLTVEDIFKQFDIISK